MNSYKYEEVSAAMVDLLEAAVQEGSTHNVPGTSAAFESALRRLRVLSNADESFSIAALGEIRRTVAMVDVMNLNFHPKSREGLAHQAYIRRVLPGMLDERKNAFLAVRDKDCG